MDLSFIFVNYNSSLDLKKAIDSLVSRINGIEYEIIIVDNASREENIKLLYDLKDRCKIVLNETNQGFAAACNKGFYKSKGEVVLFLNPDIVIVDGIFKDVVAHFRSNNKVAAMGVRMLKSNNREYPSCGRFPSLKKSTSNTFLKFILYLFGRELNPASHVMSKWIPAGIEEVDWVEGSFLFIRREAMPGFDERYFMYWEEIDLCFQLKKAGWKILYNPMMSVIHFGNTSADPANSESFVTSYKSLFYFYRKNRGFWSTLIYRFFRGLAFLWLIYRPRGNVDNKEIAKLKGYKSVCKLALLGK